MIYQEQVMQIAQVIGGYTLGAADVLRGDGQEEQGGDGGTATSSPWAPRRTASARESQCALRPDGEVRGYGFNKSHAAAYALIAYQTAYMKAHHAAAFVAELSLVMDDTDKVRALYDDAAPMASRSFRGRQRSTIASSPSIARIRYRLGGIKEQGGPSRRSSRREAEARSATCSILPTHRQAARQSPGGRGARQKRCLRCVEPHRAMLLPRSGSRSPKRKAERSAARCPSSAIPGRKQDTHRRRAQWTEAERLAHEKSPRVLLIGASVCAFAGALPAHPAAALRTATRSPR
jgi:DNA polymerase III alpha subunit